jgi:membrane fusion protein (multidrug efflux system)
VLIKDNKVASVAITVTPTDNGKFFIVNSGLKTGDKVVLEGLISLKDSIQIEPKAANADSVFKNLH